MTDCRQLVKECVEIEKIGGSVREFLSCCGFVSPWGTWFRMQLEELGRDRNHITDGKGGKDMRKLTLEDKKKAVQIALDGGNPLKFLKDIGVANPSASWTYIKKCLKARDPEKYDRLTQETEEISAAVKSVTVTLVGQDAVNSYYSDVSIVKRTDVTISGEDLEKADEDPEKITVSAEELQRVCPVSCSVTDDADISVYGVHTKIGDFMTAGGKMCWYVGDPKEPVNLPVEEWKSLMRVLPRVMQVMGIE